MSTEQNKLAQIAKLSNLLAMKRSKKFYAEKLGITEKEITNIIKNARILAKTKGKPHISSKNERKENIIKGTIESIKTVKFEPSSHKDLAMIHKVDLKKYVITNYWSKLQPNGDFTSSIFCRKKKSGDYTPEDFAKFLAKYKSNYKPIKSVPKDKLKSSIDIEVSISDYHLAKKYVTEKSGNIDKRVEAFYEIASNLVNKVNSIYNIETVVFPISNDFFHTDGYFNTTTKGTPQDVIAEYDEEYEKGFDVLVRTIEMLKSLSNNVVVVLVQGNHDRTKSFYLAHALDVYFVREGNISFLRASTPTKYVTLGNTFIGYHHGDCKLDELPLVFATGPKSSKKFGDAVFREVHTGDKHHYMAKEIKGVRIQQMPSLSGDDRWHREKNYVNNVRAALVLLYDAVKGKCGEFEERL